MGYKTAILFAAVAATTYPPTRRMEVGIACAATPAGMVQQAQGMLPLPQSFWDNVNAIGAGDFGPPPTSPVFLHLWLLEKDMAGKISSFLAQSEGATFSKVCPDGASTSPPHRVPFLTTG